MKDCLVDTLQVQLFRLKTLNDENEFNDSSCVVIVFPDHGSRYLSKIYSDEWMNNQGFYDSSFYQPKKIQLIISN